MSYLSEIKSLYMAVLSLTTCQTMHLRLENQTAISNNETQDSTIITPELTNQNDSGRDSEIEDTIFIPTKSDDVENGESGSRDTAKHWFSECGNCSDNDGGDGGEEDYDDNYVLTPLLK